MTKRLGPYFWLAIVAHLLLFLSGSLVLTNAIEQAFENKSDRYLPAYLYQQEPNLTQQAQHSSQRIASKQAQFQPKANTLPAAIAIKKQKTTQNKNRDTVTADRKNTRLHTADSSAFIQAESPVTGKPKDEPLLKELSRATATKLYYPSEAAAFHLTGRAVIRFLLHPNGTVTDISLAQSSGFRILDNAALSAIQSISPVRDANLYLTKPKVLLAGIIFG